MDLRYDVWKSVLHLVLLPIYWEYSCIGRYYDKIVVSWWIITSTNIYCPFFLSFLIIFSLLKYTDLKEPVFSVILSLCMLVVKLNLSECSLYGSWFSHPFCQSLSFNWHSLTHLYLYNGWEGMPNSCHLAIHRMTFLFPELSFDLRALYLQSRRPTAWASRPLHLSLFFFFFFLLFFSGGSI
jgi:hypothetical protein